VQKNTVKDGQVFSEFVLCVQYSNMYYHMSVCPFIIVLYCIVNSYPMCELSVTGGACVLQVRATCPRLATTRYGYVTH
jgi:hypothetical protein